MGFPLINKVSHVSICTRVAPQLAGSCTGLVEFFYKLFFLPFFYKLQKSSTICLH